MAEIAGLKLIVPSSVSVTGAGSSGSVSATGKVTFTTAETITVEGAFTSSYDNYLMVIVAKAASGDRAIRLQYRVSGSTASGSNYVVQWLGVDSTTVSGLRSSATTSHTMIDANATNHGSAAHVYFYGPNLAQPTAFRSVNVYGSSAINDYAGTHSVSTAYTAIVMTASASNLTGKLTIYGLSQ